MEFNLLAFFTLALAHFLALLSPGVDFFVIVSNTSKYGKLSGILTSFGIAFANLFYICLALFGISLVQDNPSVFLFIKIIGDLYLLYIAKSLLQAKKRDLFANRTTSSVTLKKGLLKHFFMGFFSALLNPKNSIFYFTLFSLSIKNNTSMYTQYFYALWMFFSVLFWDIFIVTLLSNKKSKSFMQKYSNTIEKISAYILIFISMLILYEIVNNKTYVL